MNLTKKCFNIEELNKFDKMPVLNVITIDLDKNMELGTIRGLKSLFEKIFVGNTKVCLISKKFPKFYVRCVADIVNNAFKARFQKEENLVDYYVTVNEGQPIFVDMNKVWEYEKLEKLDMSVILTNKYKNMYKNFKIYIHYVEKLNNIPNIQASETPSTSNSKKVCLLVFDIDKTFNPHGIPARENFIKLIQYIQYKFDVQVKIAFNTAKPADYTKSLMDIISRDFKDAGIYKIIDYSACENGAVIIKQDDLNFRRPVECGEEEKRILNTVKCMAENSKGEFSFSSMSKEYYGFIGFGKNSSYEKLKNNFLPSLSLEGKFTVYEENNGICIEPKEIAKDKAIKLMTTFYKEENRALALLAFSADALEKNSLNDLDAVKFVVDKAKSKETPTQFRVFLPKNIGERLLPYLEFKDIVHQGRGETLEGITDAIRDCIEKNLFLGVESDKNNSDTQLNSAARCPVQSGETHIHKPNMPSMQL